jgi:erythromycin esterase-like protein
MLKTLCTAALGLFTALAHAAAPDCKPEPQLKLDRITERVILVGETHGNEQSPAFVARLVCALLAQGRPVILAVERTTAEQPALDRFLASPGGAEDIRALVSDPDWASSTQDGRSSHAMLNLVDQIRRWRQAGQRVELVAMVQPWRAEAAASAAPIDPKLVQADGDRDMADSVTAALKRHTGYNAVVLAGTFHTVVGSKMHQDIIGSPSMGDVLAARLPVHAIGLSSGAGEAWVCGGPDKCGPKHLLGGSWNLPDGRVDTPVDLGAITPSNPATQLQPRTPE